MHKQRSFSLVTALVVVFFAGSAARATVDNVVVVTSLPGLSANDTIVWSTIGADAFDISTSSFPYTSTGGLMGTIALTGNDSLVAVVCPATPCSWNPIG